MNILMVGHSGAGKTSFMAGMYRYLGDESSGYGVVAKNKKQKEQLQHMARLLEKGRYPGSTDVQEVYNFVLTCNGEEIAPFRWMDYRGGILLSDDPDDGDQEKFMKAVTAADALVVFLDGEKLADNSGKWYLEYDILLSCITNSMDVERKHMFPISFVITKCDLLPDKAHFYGLARFHNLLEQIYESKTIGASIVHCAINKESCFMPFLTLAYCIYGGTPLYVDKREKAIAAAERRKKKHEPSSLLGLFGYIAEDMLSGAAGMVGLGWDSQADLAYRADRDYKMEKEKLEQLQEIAKDLKDKLVKWSEDKLIHLY